MAPRDAGLVIPTNLIVTQATKSEDHVSGTNISSNLFLGTRHTFQNTIFIIGSGAHNLSDLCGDNREGFQSTTSFFHGSVRRT